MGAGKGAARVAISNTSAAQTVTLTGASSQTIVVGNATMMPTYMSAAYQRMLASQSQQALMQNQINQSQLANQSVGTYTGSGYVGSGAGLIYGPVGTSLGGSGTYVSPVFPAPPYPYPTDQFFYDLLAVIERSWVLPEGSEPVVYGDRVIQMLDRRRRKVKNIDLMAFLDFLLCNKVAADGVQRFISEAEMYGTTFV